MLAGLTEGRIVHYVLDESIVAPSRAHLIGQHRAAIVVNAWPELRRDDGYSNLLVFMDGENDGPRSAHTAWVTSRSMSEGKEPGTWHWPEKA